MKHHSHYCRWCGRPYWSQAEAWDCARRDRAAEKNHKLEVC